MQVRGDDDSVIAELKVDRGFPTLANKMLKMTGHCATLATATAIDNSSQYLLKMTKIQADSQVWPTVVLELTKTNANSTTVVQRCGVVGARIDGLDGLQKCQDKVYGSDNTQVLGMRRVCEHVVSRQLPMICNSTLPHLTAHVANPALATSTKFVPEGSTTAIPKLFDFSRHMNGKAIRQLKAAGFGQHCFEMMHVLPAACEQAHCVGKLVHANNAKLLLAADSDFTAQLADCVKLAGSGKISVSCPRGAVKCMCVGAEHELHDELARLTTATGPFLACVASIKAGGDVVMVFDSSTTPLAHLVTETLCCV